MTEGSREAEALIVSQSLVASAIEMSHERRAGKPIIDLGVRVDANNL